MASVIGITIFAHRTRVDLTGPYLRRTVAFDGLPMSAQTTVGAIETVGNDSGHTKFTATSDSDRVTLGREDLSPSSSDVSDDRWR